MKQHPVNPSSMPTRCRAKNPAACRHHGGRVDAQGNHTPYPHIGLDSRPKKIREGKKRPDEYRTRQGHGFRNEYRICRNHNLHKYNNYTHQWDAYTADVTPHPVSIKTAKSGSDIELGDLFRQASHNRDFYLSVSQWEGSTDNIVDECVLFIPKEYWSSLFSHHDLDEDIRNVLKRASNDRSYDEQWKKDIADLKARWGTDRVIRLRPKRDHKKQKRMQCAINAKAFRQIREKFEVKDFTAHLAIK